MGASADAFAVSLGRGTGFRRSELPAILGTGLVFGAVAAIAPVIGWLAGSAANGLFAAVDHWIAFAILSLLGIAMIRGEKDGARETNRAPVLSVRMLLLAAIAINIDAAAVNIDAAAVGMTLGLVKADITATALAIGAATFLMSGLGMVFGRIANAALGHTAATAGGLMLIAVGFSIPLRHLAII